LRCSSTAGASSWIFRSRHGITRFLERPGIEPAPLGHNAASRSYRLYQLEHRDPADRLLIATAIELACPLVTYDQRILRFSTDYGRQYGFAAMA
jgi:PIN domain nuclease of toxin-antitoxin system